MAREHYRTQPLGVNATYIMGGAHIAGFLATVSGTLTITEESGTVLVNAVPVTAGTWLRIPLLFDAPAGGVVTLGGGAAGTLFL